MSQNIRVFLLVTVSIVLLSAAECRVKGGTGGGSSSHDRDRGKTPAGHFSGCSQRCLKFSTADDQGYTGRDGRYPFESGDRIRFYIGDLVLGDEVEARDSMTPANLFPGASMDSPRVVNLARLLISLDSTPEDERVSIPKKVHRRLVLSNQEVAHSIRSMDFADEAAFSNAASQILSTLAETYAFTPVLADQEAARRWLRRLP